MASQQGNPPQGAPGRTLVSLLISQPAINPDGTVTTWFGQYLQRQSQFIGPVQTGSGLSGSLSEQIVTVNDAVGTLQATAGSQSIPASTQSTISDLLDAMALGLSAPAPPAAFLAPQHQIPPLAALEPWLTAASVQNNGTATTAIYAPLVNGDLPGPTLLSDPHGQTIMVQIR